MTAGGRGLLPELFDVVRRRVAGPRPTVPQRAGEDAPAPVSEALQADLAWLARGVLGLLRLDDLPEDARVRAVRGELLRLALAHDHVDVVPLLLLELARVPRAAAEAVDDRLGAGAFLALMRGEPLP